MIGILIFIDQDVAKTRAIPGAGLREALQNIDRFADEIVKVHGVSRSQALLIGGKYFGNDLFKVIGGRIGVVRRSNQFILCGRDKPSNCTGRILFSIKVEFANDYRQ